MSCLFGEKMKNAINIWDSLVNVGLMWELWPRCSKMLVYLTTKLGDFVRANVGKYSSTMEHMGEDWVHGLSGALPIIIVLLSPCRWRCNWNVMGYNQRTMRPKWWRSLDGNTLVFNHGIWGWDEAAKNRHPVGFDMIWLLLLISWFINPIKLTIDISTINHRYLTWFDCLLLLILLVRCYKATCSNPKTDRNCECLKKYCMWNEVRFKIIVLHCYNPINHFK